MRLIGSLIEHLQRWIARYKGRDQSLGSTVWTRTGLCRICLSLNDTSNKLPERHFTLT